MKILVTGGAGYLGSKLVPSLLKDGHEVTVLDSFIYRQTPLLDVCYDKKLSIIRNDVRNKDVLDKELKKADAIITLAALVGAPLCECDKWTSQHVNTDVIKYIVNNKSNSQILVYPCTNSGYGIGQEGIYCTEDSPLMPISLYGKQKVEAETAILDSGEGVTFRLATVFGVAPRMRMDLLVNDFTNRALTDKTVVLFEAHFKRNYVHVGDVAGAFKFALSNYEKLKGRPYNFGLSEANLSKYELCQTIQKHVPDFKFLVSEIGEDPDKRNYIVSNERIEKAGFKATTTLDQGIEELMRGYKILRRSQFVNVW